MYVGAMILYVTINFGNIGRTGTTESQITSSMLYDSYGYVPSSSCSGAKFVCPIGSICLYHINCLGLKGATNKPLALMKARAIHHKKGYQVMAIVSYAMT